MGLGMHKYSKLIGVALAASLLAGCSDIAAFKKAEKSYRDMTEAEQVVEMEKYVTAFNTAGQSSANKAGTNLAIQHHGDSKTDIIYAVGTYPKRVSAKEIRQVKRTLEKIKANENICARAEMVELNGLGMGYQAIIKDLSGKVLYKTEVCQGAAATPAKEAASQHKLRG